MGVVFSLVKRTGNEADRSPHMPLWFPQGQIFFGYYTVAQKERIFFFQIIVTVFIFNIKNYINTKTTCNKCSFDYVHWLLNYGKLYRKDGVLHAVPTSGSSPQSSASHLLTFLVVQLQFLREWKLSDRRLYEIFERRLLISGNPKERNRRQIYPFKKHAFFLRHSVCSTHHF